MKKQQNRDFRNWKSWRLFRCKLAAAKLPDVDVVFIAPNQTKQVLKEKGLKLITDEGEQIAYAQLVSDNPDEIGRLDC